jgi:hypothetical protein
VSAFNGIWLDLAQYLVTLWQTAIDFLPAPPR